MTGKNGNDLSDENETIFLFLDSSLRYEDCKNYLKQKSVKIITFDYESHHTLHEKNIPHIISDDFLTLEDMDEIQSKSYDFARWHKDDRFQKSMTYEGINLGLLIQTEFNYFLIPFLKKFVETIKIFHENKQANFFVSQHLAEIMGSFYTNITIISKTNQNEEFYYDSVKIPLKIRNHSFSINVSKKNYDRIKKISGQFINLFLKENIPKNNKSVLFVEFDPIRYHKLFSNMNNVKCDFSLYNIRKPAIWNKESFTIIKKSNCTIIDSEKLFKKSSKKIFENDIKEIRINLEALFEREEFFEIFSFHDKSFWKIIKRKIKDLFEKRIPELIINIQKGKKLFEENNFSSILVWSEIGSTEQILIKLAKQRNIPVVLLQHGLFFDSGTKGAYEMNVFHGVYPVDADEIIVWGKIEKDHQMSAGISEKNIHVLGSPLFDDFSDNIESSTNIVTLATSGPVKENIFDLTVKTIEKNIETIKTISQSVNKFNKKLIIKTHPSPDEFNPTELVHKINKDIEIINNGDITEIIKKSDIFIVIDVSTVIINAQLLGKPVISAIVKDSGYGVPSVLSTNSCLQVNSKDFEINLRKILSDKEFKNEILQKGEEYVKEYLENIGSASENILNFLSKYNHK